MNNTKNLQDSNCTLYLYYMENDKEIFKGKSFSDLLKEIYVNSTKKEKQINSLIQELRPLVKNIGDATVIVPLIKEYLDVAVKNDDHLIKMAAIVQRAMSRTESEGGEFSLTDEERKQLLTEIEHSEKNVEDTDGKTQES